MRIESDSHRLRNRGLFMPAMKLKSVKYAEFLGRDKEWSLDELSLGDINLIVGLNASGKTRTLNVLGNFARMLLPSENVRPVDGTYDVTFDDNGKVYRYQLAIEESRITMESLYHISHGYYLRRDASGEGTIFAVAENKPIRFKSPENELAVVAKRDLLQHPYLELLNEWALSVRHYTFGTPLGRDAFAFFVKGAPAVNDRDTNQVVAIFRKGKETFPGRFDQSIKADMSRLGYFIDEITICPLQTVRVIGPGFPEAVSGIAVEEKGVKGFIEQTEISQGMFRALSIIIQINYSQMAKRSNCILIDDIGEGLDFDRSTRLIDLLREKAKESVFQLVMTTNDRFVMNSVPLEEWLVLRREGNKVTVHNYSNSKEAFDEFKFTGLSNFSFLELDFLTPPEEGTPSDLEKREANE